MNHFLEDITKETTATASGGLPDWARILILVVAIVLVAVAIVIIILISRKQAKIKASEKAFDEKIKSSASTLSLCFGGNDNIKEISQRGSRVSVLVDDMSKVDKTKIDTTLNSVMYMGNKVVFIIGSKSEEFSKLLEENVAKQKK
jgi:phosphotransferase system IIB component